MMKNKVSCIGTQLTVLQRCDSYVIGVDAGGQKGARGSRKGIVIAVIVVIVMLIIAGVSYILLTKKTSTQPEIKIGTL